MATYATKPRAPGAIGSPGVMQLPPPPKVQPPDVGGAMTNLGGIPQPVQPGRIQAPNLPGSPQAPNFNYAPTTVGAAPTPTPFGDFTAPDPSQVLNDPGAQFRMEQANKGANRSAAARGTLLSGGFQTALAKLNQGLASQEYGNIYNRALQSYGANRDTNAQNFGQSLGSYQAGTGAQLDAGRLNLAGQQGAYDRNYGAARDRFGDETAAAIGQTGVINANQQAQDLFAQQMENYRAEVERQRMADAQQPLAPPPPVGRAPAGRFVGPRFGGGSLGGR